MHSIKLYIFFSQVHQAWEVEPRSDIAMNRTTGRDTIKISKKGAVQVDEFNKDVRRNVDVIGPGIYYNEEGNVFGDSAVGGAVKFDSMLNRSEVIGPKGEKPLMYQQKDMVNDDGYKENVKEELILDRDTAKDNLKKHAPDIILYDRVSLIVCFLFCDTQVFPYFEFCLLFFRRNDTLTQLRKTITWTMTI